MNEKPNTPYKTIDDDEDFLQYELPRLMGIAIAESARQYQLNLQKRMDEAFPNNKIKKSS